LAYYVNEEKGYFYEASLSQMILCAKYTAQGKPLLCKEAYSKIFSPHLLISFNLEYRTNILESGPESVVDKRKQDGSAKHRRRPVHGCGSYRGSKWPKCKEPDWC
jgi:hypothetical protein